MAWIKTISEEEATGSVKQQYDAAVKRAGRVFNIVKISSLKPEIMRTFIQQRNPSRSKILFWNAIGKEASLRKATHRSRASRASPSPNRSLGTRANFECRDCVNE